MCLLCKLFSHKIVITSMQIYIYNMTMSLCRGYHNFMQHLVIFFLFLRSFNVEIILFIYFVTNTQKSDRYYQGIQLICISADNCIILKSKIFNGISLTQYTHDVSFLPLYSNILKEISEFIME